MIRLREARHEDIGFIVSCLKDKGESFVEQCGYGKRFFTYPITAAQLQIFMDTRHDTSIYIIIMNDDEAVGSMELMINKEGCFCNIARFLITEKARFKGYGTDALLAASDYVFNNLKLVKVTLSVFDFNESAVRCYIKAGFKVSYTELRNNGWTAIYMEKLPIGILNK